MQIISNKNKHKQTYLLQNYICLLCNNMSYSFLQYDVNHRVRKITRQNQHKMRNNHF